METNHGELLLAEQQKTNELLTQLVHAQIKKNKQESRRFWLGLFIHAIPLIVSAIFLWQMYNYVQDQANLWQQKFTNIEADVGSLNLGKTLHSLLN